ncbi:hypothetical protein ACFYVL_28190 [Streptomyces sp. NPDC004111]|uniref:hypothetical protein n=1 Tax=Streptomyces sp. NPDC004111 TaxID=3364690 RepID=UPI0036807542
MSFTISALLLTGLIVCMLVRYKAVGVGAAIVVLLFGFYLARSPLAPSLDKVVTTVSDAVPDI